MSILDIQHLNQQIKNKLFEISYKIECFNRSGDFDISRYAESYFKELLNIIYSSEGWFFKKAEKINQDTFDLYDDKSRVCIQITANKRVTKKEETIKQFETKGHHEKYDSLIIIFISNKKPVKKITPKGNYQYVDFDIVEFCSLIEGKCDSSSLLKIRDILCFSDNLSKTVAKKANGRKLSGKISEKEFIRCMKLEKELKSELLISDPYKRLGQEEILKYPFKKFRDSRFILRSITDISYPEVNEASQWCRTFMYDFYDKGILIYLNAIIGKSVAINQKREWFVRGYSERETPVPDGFTEVSVRILAKLPYRHILHYKEGDEYYNDYHLYCKYDGILDSPYEDINYVVENDLGYFWIELDNSKELKS